MVGQTTAAAMNRGHLWVLAAALLFTGCSDFFEGESEYEQVQKRNQSFNGLLTEAGGSAVLKGEQVLGFQDAGWFIVLEGSTITDEIITAIIEANEKDPVFQIRLSKSTITNEQLEKLDEAKVLEKVFVMDLSDTEITDDGLDKLNHMHCISQLNLKGSRATADGANRLGQRKISSELTPAPLKKAPQVEI